MKKIFILLISIIFISIGNGIYCIANAFEDAEILYTKINDFLSEHGDIEPEKFDNFCRNYMATSNFKSLENKESYENNIVLYRGVSDKKFAEEFKNGKVFIGSNLTNVRGSGIYTTSDLDLAKSYTDKASPECIIKIIISKNNTKILENNYLGKLQYIIMQNHPKEFGEFQSKVKNDYIFDSMKDYLDKQTELILEECKKIKDPKTQNKLFEEKLAKLNEDPTFKKLNAQRKKYFKTNKSYVWYNSGLLTKLLGFDALHSFDYLSDFINSRQDEYLIVNTSVLNIIE